MTTEAQTIANRTNAQKSTGPKTDQGKTAASQNSVKHGLLARSNVIMSESQEEFDLHRDLLLEELAPATPMESMLAERIVSLSWRLKRTETIHTQTFDALDERNNNSPLSQFAKSMLLKPLQPPKRDPALPELDLTLGRLVVKDFSNSKVIDRLLRYERRIENSLYKTMHELQRLKLIKNINTENQASSHACPACPERGEAESKGATRVNQQTQKMQNEPNFHRIKPNPNPIYEKSNPKQTKFKESNGLKFKKP
jgi:hypothetical protein